MSLLDTLRAGVKTANKITRPLQSELIYERVKTRDEYGDQTDAASIVHLHAIIDFKQTPIRTADGITTVAMATLTLLDVVEVINATNGEGVEVDDVFTLPDGSKGKVISIGGFMDAGTDKPIPLTISLG